MHGHVLCFDEVFAYVSSQMLLCASIFLAIFIICGLCTDMIPECQKALAFVLFLTLAGPSEVQVSKPNVYTATKSKRTKHSWRLLSVSWPIRDDSQKPVQCVLWPTKVSIIFPRRILIFIVCV